MAVWIPSPWSGTMRGAKSPDAVQCPVKAPEKEPVCPMPEPAPKRARKSSKKA